MHEERGGRRQEKQSQSGPIAMYQQTTCMAEVMIGTWGSPSQARPPPLLAFRADGVSCPTYLPARPAACLHPACAGGKTEDFLSAAKLFYRAKRQVKVPTYLVPATQKVSSCTPGTGPCRVDGQRHLRLLP